MTKERRLAIEMWEHIKKELSNDPDVNIVKLKREFCAQHELNWENCCWFCTYIPNCASCPLNGCIDYARVLDERKSLKVRLDACDVIINALKGK